MSPMVEELIKVTAEGAILLSEEDGDVFGGIGLGAATASIELRLSEFGQAVDIQAPVIVQ